MTTFADLRRGLPLALVLLAACASYAPLPLTPAGGGLRQAAAELDNGGQPLPAQLGPDQVGVLALRNSPELRAARAQRGVAQAQLLAAGILPNPSFSGSYQFLLGGPGSYATLAAGLSQDLKSVVTLSARRDAEASSGRQLDAGLEWQEWQTIGKARLLCVDLVLGAQQAQALQDAAVLFDERLQRSRQALQAGDATLATLVPDLGAAADLHKQLDDQRRQQDTRLRELDALLGLQPGATLPLVDGLEPEPVDAAAVRALLPGLAQRRPDLLALQLGYQAQEDKVRAAILAQFPTLSVGPAYGRDSSDVRTLGPQITIDLPLFDRNQGNIAIERATRQQLHDEFGVRVDLAQGEVLGLLADLQLLQQQLAARQPQLDELQRSAVHADAAYRAGDLDERGRVELLSALNAKRLEVLTLKQTLLEQQVAIAALTGAGMPPASLPAGEAR